MAFYVLCSLSMRRFETLTLLLNWYSLTLDGWLVFSRNRYDILDHNLPLKSAYDSGS